MIDDRIWLHVTGMNVFLKHIHLHEKKINNFVLIDSF